MKVKIKEYTPVIIGHNYSTYLLSVHHVFQPMGGVCPMYSIDIHMQHVWLCDKTHMISYNNNRVNNLKQQYKAQTKQYTL